MGNNCLERGGLFFVRIGQVLVLIDADKVNLHLFKKPSGFYDVHILISSVRPTNLLWASASQPGRAPIMEG